MKRLITILLSLVGCISLFGQVPVVVAGKVHISGPMYSAGQVNVYAATVDTGKVDIDAAGMLIADTIILYSNNTSDGLLRNQKATGGVVGTDLPGVTREVVLRKTFSHAAFTYFSVPFPVASSNVRTSNTGTSLTGGGNYWVYQFDAQRTSDTIDLKAWKELTYANGFAKGVGYQLWYENPNNLGVGGSIDFYTTDATAMNTLFNAANKTNAFNVYSNITGQFSNPAVGDGWAFLGGLNSTTFTYKGGSISDYTGTIWYRDATNSLATGSTVGAVGFRSASLAGIDTVNLPPYTPFYIQVGRSSTTSITSGTFTSTPVGLAIASATYRSSTDVNPIKDQLYFLLTSDNDQSSDHFYMNFADDYTESYQGVEDALKMTTFYDNSPAIWTVQDKTNTPLFVNGLPMVNGREAQMGFSVPEAGDYTISLDALRQQDVKNVILVDNVTGKKVDLLQYPYSFSTAGAVKSEDGRFALYINSSYTEIPSIGSDGIYAYAKDNVLTVKNLSDGDKVQVLDLAGRTIAFGKASGKEFSAALSQKGVYVVNVVGGKTSVLKVLNK